MRPALGEWKLVELEVDGAKLEPATGEVQVLTLIPRLTPTADGWALACSATLVGNPEASASAVLTPERVASEPGPDNTSRILDGDFAWSLADEELHLDSEHVRARFAPAVNDYLLMRRGFRWINEYPFNR